MSAVTIPRASLRRRIGLFARVIRQAEQMADGGLVRDAIDLLSSANRSARSSLLERALVRVRRAGGAQLGVPEAAVPHAQVPASEPTGAVVELAPHQLDATSYRAGLAESGCVLVRGLISPAQVARVRFRPPSGSSSPSSLSATSG